MKIASFIFFIFLTFGIYSQSHIWTRTNPGGGGAFSTIGASASGIIIAGSDLSGAYRSKDMGKTWDVIGANKGLTETHVSGVGFHKKNGNILYLGTESGIFRSDDGGNTVNQVLESGYITDIEFGTDKTNIGYAAYHPYYDASEGQIYKSIDNGLTWYKISTDLPENIRILKILVNPNDADTVYFLTGSGRFFCGNADVFKSVDGGIHWENLTSDLSEVLDIAFDPIKPQNVFITTMNVDCNAEWYSIDLTGNLYKSFDGGKNWGVPLSNRTGIILIDANNSNKIILLDPRQSYPWNETSGAWTSTDGGNSFVKTGDVNDWDTFFNGHPYYCYGISFNGICKTIGNDLSTPNKYYWVNSQFVFSTEDFGTHFDNLFTREISPGFWQSRGFDNVNMQDICISKSNPDIVFAAYFDIGLWRSLDKGKSWQSCNDSIFTGNWEGRGGNCATVLCDPDRTNVVWASMSQNQNGEKPTFLIKNNDTGEKNKWFLANTNLPDEEIMGLSIDINSPANNRTLYVTAKGNVYKSIDDGNQWNLVFACDDCRFTAVDQFDGNIVYAGGGQGIWQSKDAGKTWSDISLAEMKGDINTKFWDWNWEGIFDIKTDPNIANTVYVAVYGDKKGLYRSKDAGQNWQKLLTNNFMRKVAIMPQNSDYIYATSSSAFESGGYDERSKGVLFSKDGGYTWSQQNKGMAYPFALAVDIDNTATPEVFVGSPGTGFQKSPVPVSTNIKSNTLNKKEISIFPNPAHSEVFIRTDEDINSIEIYNIFGEIVLSRKNNTYNLINISSLHKGLYFIKINTIENCELLKLLKE